MHRIHIFRQLIRAHFLYLVGGGVFLILIMPFIVSQFPYCEVKPTPELITNMMNMGTVPFLVAVVILAPVFETLLFQYLVIKGIRYVLIKLRHNLFWVPVVLSGLLFGLDHRYNLHYLISGIFIGIILAFLYRIFMHRKENEFGIIMLVHSLVNLIVFSLEFIFA